MHYPDDNRGASDESERFGTQWTDQPPQPLQTTLVKLDRTFMQVFFFTLRRVLHVAVRHRQAEWFATDN